MTESNGEETLNEVIKDFIKSKKYENKTVIKTRPLEQPLESNYKSHCLFCGKKLPEYGVYGPRRRRLRSFCNVRCKRHHQGMKYTGNVGWTEINEKRPKVCVLCGSQDYAVLGLCKECYAKKEEHIRKKRKEIDKRYREKKKGKNNLSKQTLTKPVILPYSSSSDTLTY